MQQGAIGPQQTPLAVNLDLLREEAKLLALNFKQDGQLSRFGAEILSNLETPNVVENLQTKVFDQLKPEDLEGKPLQLKAAQRFISQFPGVAKRVQFGEQHEAHPLLVRAAVGPIFREMMGQFNETETIQSIAARLNPEMSPLFHEYFEKGTVSPTIAQVPELLKLADQLNITGLLEVARKNIEEHKVLAKLTAAQANEWLELALNRNMGWLQLTLLQEMKKRAIAPDATKPKLVALCTLYNKDKNSETLDFNAEKQIRFSCIKPQDLVLLKEFNAVGLRIESLTLKTKDVKLNAAVIGTLNQLKNLSHLSCESSLKNEGVHQLAEVLKTNESLRKLNLMGNEIGVQGALDLASALKVNETLLSLNLLYNQMGNEGAKALAESLKSNHTLKELLLGNNNIGSEGAVQLAEALRVNSTLINLNMSSNPLTLEGSKEILQALMVNRTLTGVNLYRILDWKENEEGVGDKLASWIAEALSKNNTIKILEIGSNGISAIGVSAIAGALSNHLSLEQLSIESNPIQDDGARQLAGVLTSNQKLLLLALNRCGLSDEGANQFAEALKRNATLIELDLGVNKIADAGASKLAEALTKNATLRVLGLGYNEFGEIGAEALSKAMQQNTTVVRLDLIGRNLPTHVAQEIYDTFKRRVPVALPYPVIE